MHKEGSPIKRSHRNQRGSREVSVFSHYGPAPAVVFRNPNLSPGAKAVYGYLCTFVNSAEVRQGDMKAWPSRRRMERELGISSNTLSKYLRELRDHALIKIQRTRVLRDGRVVYGNNLYILQASVILVDDHGGSAQSSHLVEMISHSECEPPKFSESQDVPISNTMTTSDTKNLSNNHLSLDRSKQRDTSSQCLAPRQVTKPNDEREEQLSVNDLIAFWNAQGVNPHGRMGKRTRERIERALSEALEDFSEEEILGAVRTYAKVYTERRCEHKYRLVEFMEKRGYEHFLHEENWARREPRQRVRREDFAYSTPRQDRSLFTFLNDQPPDDQHEEP